MSAAIISVSSGNNGGTTGIATIPAPTSITAGNILIALITTDGGSSINLPTGFSSITTGASSGPRFQIASKVAGSSEPGSYGFSPSGSTPVDIKVTILNTNGLDQTTPINGFFPNTQTSATQTAGSSTGTQSIPTRLACLPVAMFAIQWLSPTGPVIPAPTGLTSGWTQQTMNVWQDTSNYSNSANDNGYNATMIASRAVTSDLTSAITAGCTWGGSFSVFSPGLTAMLFLNPVVAGTLSASPSPLLLPGAGTANAQQVIVSQPGYTGTIAISVPTDSQSLAAIALTQSGTYGTNLSLTGPNTSFWTKELSPGDGTILIQGG